MSKPSNSTFKWLLFDADNTLLEFPNTSKQAMWKTFEQYDRKCSDELYEIYQKINHQAWSDFEKKLITAEDLRSKRFRLFFNAINDEIAPPALFNQQYLEHLVKCSTAYDGVHEFLQSLKEANYIMSIVTNGLKEVQRRRLDRLQLTHFFDSIIVSDEIGVAKPNIEYFDVVYQSIPNPPNKSETLIIGDGLKSDILGGKNFGISTCWIKNGQTNSTDIQPDFEIEQVFELNQILKS